MRTTARGRSYRPLMVPLLVLLAAACEGSGSPLDITPAAQPFAIRALSTTILVPRSIQLSTRGGRDTGIVLWGSSDQAVATISASGLVTTRFPGLATVTARRGVDSTTLTLTVTASRIVVGGAPVILEIKATHELAAAVLDADGAVISGVPVSWSTDNARIATVDSLTGIVTAIAAGTTMITAAGGGATGVLSAYISLRQLVFSEIGSHGNYICGLEAPTGHAYCWGDNHAGALGIGFVDGTDLPEQVLGGRRFSGLSVGHYATCGLERLTGFAYCWGGNSHGDLGDGTRTTRWEPTLVANGGIRFSSVSASGAVTCGVEVQTALGYCWGMGGLLGDGMVTQRSLPNRIESDSLRFRTISVSSSHVCGIELLSGHAYCWGRNTHGQLGDGTTNDRLVPTRVAGNISFASIDADNQITCGSEAETGRGYCWGQNSEGQIGDGTKTDRLTPAIVGGGNIRFSRVEAADLACGIELVTGAAYCWGNDTTVPTVVAAGGLRFSSIITAYGWAYGVAAQTGHGYRWDSKLLPAPLGLAAR